MSETKWKPNDEQREILLALQAECAKEETVVAFASKFLPWGRSKFDQIMDVFDDKVPRSYFDKVSAPVIQMLIDELRLILDSIPLKRLQLSRIGEQKIIVTSKLKALKAAVDMASVTTGPERLIINIGPTGAGKTITCNYLSQQCNARFVEVRDIWRRSETGYVPLRDICEGVGVRSGKLGNNIATIQDALIKYCEERKIVICFDEGEHFGKSALNLLKLLLNKTKLVPVIFVVPSEYDKWFQWYPNEADQIARRTMTIIDSSIISPTDAKLFFPKDQFADPEKALEVILREANTFGHYSLISRVARELAGVKGAMLGEAGDVTKAIQAAKRQMRRDPRTKQS